MHYADGSEELGFEQDRSGMLEEEAEMLGVDSVAEPEVSYNESEVQMNSKRNVVCASDAEYEGRFSAEVKAMVSRACEVARRAGWLG